MIALQAIREGQTSVEMEDIICFGDSSAPCGSTRHLCPIGSYGPMNGTMPCSLCPQGTFSSKPGTTECVKCPQHTNTTATGTNSSKGCVPLCKPGYFGSSESGTQTLNPETLDPLGCLGSSESGTQTLDPKPCRAFRDRTRVRHLNPRP
jgi:hypothetical protein